MSLFDIAENLPMSELIDFLSRLIRKLECLHETKRVLCQNC